MTFYVFLVNQSDTLKSKNVFLKYVQKIIKDKLEYVTDPKILASVKIQLRKRQKKRASLGRRNAAYHQERVKKENDRKIVSQQIDDWMIAQVEIAASVKRVTQILLLIVLSFILKFFNTSS